MKPTSSTDEAGFCVCMLGMSIERVQVPSKP